ncbi:MAG: tRNA (N(6)-L-threonylcarbamoyladenosine(37)-C(2))-methylthiotransferase MtaB [Clostridia bacterium]|nr:tRNA (N(6)-L-threonylcarbamoyladenosine(37)-C(2))-methylthiotransferase MtaB [Clostridia bacterium]
MEKRYTVGLYTLGCKVSQYETEAIAEEFEKNGFLRRDFEDECDVYVINTCTVTQESNRKSRQFIRRAIKKNENAVVMVIGCYSQTSSREIEKIEGVSYISGTDNKLILPKKALALLEEKKKPTPVCEVTSLENARFEDMQIEKTPRTRAYIKIEDGCDCRCTYCAIPNARGPVRSRDMQSILDEIKGLSEKGVKEVVLTGIEIASYGKDLGNARLIDLIEEIERTGYIKQLRLGSITPEVLTEDFILRLKNISSLAPQLHISLQSGSDSVLKNMKRRYNTEKVGKALSLLRLHIPNIMFTCDVIAGFPMESEENFLETLSFMERARFLYAHIFAYSKRDNTPAADYDGQIDESVKRERCKKLADLQRRVTDDILQTIVDKGDEMNAIFETFENGLLSGHTDSFIEVRAEGNDAWRGQIRPIIPLSHKNGVLFCKIK